MKLDGIKVVDLSMFLPGPLMTQMMADHGAEVVKIETVDEGEPNRHIGLKRDGVSVFFANTHRGKKSLTLNLKTEAGHAAFMRLAKEADVVVEAFRPGVAKRLKIDYETVAAANPRIVYASISAFGQYGPYVDRPAHDPATQGYAGILSVNEGQDGKPTMSAIASADMLSSMIALGGVAMALYRREKTGRGDFVDVAMMDSLVACMPNNLGPPMAEKRPPNPKDERSWGGQAMMRLYETKDAKWIVLGGAEMKFARNLLTRLGRPDLIDLCALPPGPPQHAVRDFFVETFKGKTQAEWEAWFLGMDVCFAPVRNLREGLDDPQLRAREMVLTDARGWEHIGLPVKYREEPGRVDFRLPEHGQHSAELLARLGYTAEEIARMKDAGVW
jgi:crotonobetainyl-CoA:carnitine CoA-transferase CaiB-like acyl-CoA transferase